MFKYFEYELKANDTELKLYQRLPTFLYDVCSKYGQSILRPFVFLLITILLTFIGLSYFYYIDNCHNKNYTESINLVTYQNQGNNIRNSLELQLKKENKCDKLYDDIVNIFAVSIVRTIFPLTKVENFGLKTSNLFGLILVLQSLFGSIFLFLLILGLRNKFRINYP
jgi:hypothetical protein